MNIGLGAFERFAKAARARLAMASSAVNGMTRSGRNATSSLATVPLTLKAVFVQYDRKKYAGALERLLHVLDRLGGVDYSVIVVDNAQPGDWVHEVSARLVHIGGDNSAWEFSAFDRGLAHLDAISSISGNGAANRRCLHALVTDAYTAYGEEFLSLIDRRVLERAHASNACIGWVDAWPQEVELMGRRVREWMRTSFLIFPAELSKKLRPLAAPLERSRLFSENASEPFLPNAPLDETLRGYLLQWLSRTEPRHPIDRWHSQFELDSATLPYFQDKVCAILREYLLASRLRELSTPCYDLRLIHQLSRHGVDWNDLNATTRRTIEWGGWRNVRLEELGPALRHHVERLEIAEVCEHGKPLAVEVEGWVLAKNLPNWVRLQTASGLVLHGSCSERREDVLHAFPNFDGHARTFTIKGLLRGLPPGTHDLELCLDGASAAPVIKSVQIIPVTEFTLRRIFLPESWPAGRPLLASIEGELRSSVRATSVTVELDGEKLDLPLVLGPDEHDDSGAWSQKFLLNAELLADESRSDHRLDVVFALADGNTHTFSRFFHAVSKNELSHTLRRFEIGPYRASSGMTTVRIEVDLQDTQPGDHLVLYRHGIEVLEVPVLAPQKPGNRPGWTDVTLEREVDSVPPGKWNVALAVRRDGRRITLFNGEVHVPFERPDVYVETLEATFCPGQDRATHRLTLRGWVRNHFVVDCLIVEIDGGRAAAIGLDVLRPDVAEAFKTPLVSRQGFDASIDLHDISPGEHIVHLVACQRGGETERISRRVVFPDNAISYFNVTSDDLDLLLSNERAHRYGSLKVGGKIETRASDLVATLVVDGRRADEQSFEQPGTHALSLRSVPRESGEHELRFVVSSNGRAVYETPPRRVQFQRLTLPEAPTRALGRFLDHFELRDRIVGFQSDVDLLGRLLERQPERIAEFFEVLSAIETRVARALDRAKKPERARLSSSDRPRSAARERPLRVLLVSWEAPHRYHGGGVYLTNLIEHLGRRHEISVIHTRGIDEIGLADALRPSVKKLIGVGRQHREALFRADARLPDLYYNIYTPELRRTIELELQSGAYDIVDYHYTALGPYVVASTPRVMTVHELGYTALLNTHFVQASPIDAALPALEKLIRLFHYNTVELARLCPNLIALTEEDASGIADYCPEAKVFVNSPGVDSGFLRPPRDQERSEAPALLYVGNYNHPPNVRATRFFAQEVMPLLRMRHPSLTFRVVGSNMVPQVAELDGLNGTRVIGLVQDLRAELWRAAACVAPIFTGTGMRVKVLEALASGTPLVSTALGVRGLALSDGKHFLMASNPQQFAAAISSLLLDPAQARAIGKEARRLVERDHDWERAARAREAIWQTALQQEPAPRSERERPSRRPPGGSAARD